MTDSSAPVDGWVLVEFDCEPARAELLADDLWSRGVAAVEVVDTPDGRVTLRTSLGADSAEAVADIQTAHGVSSRLVSFPSSVADTWRAHAEPTHVVDDVWLVPAWMDPPTDSCILVEPFDTFGLGNHPTTVLTLRSALPHTGGESLVLDLGSGSGVLSVAVSALRGCRAEAHDIAPQGENALHHNALLNNVAGNVVWRGPLTDADAAVYDLVMANILAPALRELARDIERATKPGGIIVISGIRTDQVESVLQHFELSRFVDSDEQDGWEAVTLVRG